MSQKIQFAVLHRSNFTFLRRGCSRFNSLFKLRAVLFSSYNSLNFSSFSYNKRQKTFLSNPLHHNTMTCRAAIKKEEITLTQLPLLSNLQMQIKSDIESVNVDLFVAALKAPASNKNEEEKCAKKSLAVVPPQVDGVVKGALTELVKRQQFSAGEGKTATVFLNNNPNILEAAVLGLGSSSSQGALDILEGFNTNCDAICCNTASKTGKALADLIVSTKAKRVALAFQTTDLTPLALECFLEGLFLGVTPDERYKSKKTECPVELTHLYLCPSGEQASYKSVIEHVIHTASGIQLTRELTNSPSNYCTTESLAKTAVQMAQQYGLQHLVLGEKECRERKMGAYLAVHQGSMYEPQFIHLTYKPTGPIKKRIAYVGKGLCMDTGGYNLKVNCGIETMKVDMGAAAAVFGAARIIGGLKPQNVEVHFIVAAAENMISSKAYRPGDIVVASNGKTIEVGNTDAEGRLTLADALVYAETVVQPDLILDCATLTGACMVGLGNDIGAIYGTDKTWLQTLLKSSTNTGTPLWPMPLFKPYRRCIDGKLADLSNLSSTRYGGSITAALFLKEFVKDTPWCHMDIAGVVYDQSTKDGTGYGAKLLANAVIELAATLQ